MWKTKGSNEIADILANYIQPLFSQLPPELRLKIWKLNLPTTRVVPMSCSVASPSLRDAPLCTTNQFFAGCTSDASVPVNLHVCAESRADALKHFQPSFGFARLPGHIYFNPASDILYFGPQDGYMAADAQFHTCLSMCDPSELASVRRIAISDALFWVGESYNSMTAASLTFEVFRQLSVRMPALQQIIFVPREQDEVSMPVLTEERMFQQIMMAIRTHFGIDDGFIRDMMFATRQDKMTLIRPWQALQNEKHSARVRLSAHSRNS
ncbi:hypothetical protein E4U35_000043 [Claviceps purpurea]|nr:hypothetical protein E4U35_000043 [Claviceps purpurea]